MAEEKAPQEALAPAQPVGDEAVTVYGGLTVGEIVKDRDAVYHRAQALENTVKEKTHFALVQSERLTALEEQLQKSQAEIERLKMEKAAPTPNAIADALEDAGMTRGLEKMKDGSLRLVIRVPEEQAIPLLSWADSAGEAPQAYIQKLVEESLVAVVSS